MNKIIFFVLVIVLAMSVTVAAQRRHSKARQPKQPPATITAKPTPIPKTECALCIEKCQGHYTAYTKCLDRAHGKKNADALVAQCQDTYSANHIACLVENGCYKACPPR